MLGKRIFGVATVACLALACSPGNSTPDASLDASSDGASIDSATDTRMRPPPSVPFATGPYGTTIRSIAADFTVPTLSGDWNFRNEWTGTDSYVFVLYNARDTASVQLWETGFDDLLAESPKNVHYFFLPYRENDNQDRAMQRAMEMQQRAEDAYSRMSAEDVAHWQTRLHFIPVLFSSLDNWIEDMLRARPERAFAIDRFQRLRQVGLLAPVTGSTPVWDLGRMAYEVRYFNFEWDRGQRRAASPPARTVRVLERREVRDNATVEVMLPSAEELRSFDSLEVELGLYCRDGLDRNCGEWDYLAYLRVCDPVDPAMPMAPPRCPTELGRWITPYHREGQWFTDLTPMLPLLAAGGNTRLQFSAPAQPMEAVYVVDLALHFGRRNRGFRPVELRPLWQGEFAFDENIAMRLAPQSFMAPADARRVELVAVITGHGFGAERSNCAEFCNHTHRFALNGGTEAVKSHPEAGTADGCARQVEAGVVPNQYGTWPLGRGGWCPGLEVRPFVVDLTAQLRAGTMNELTYRALLRDAVYRPMPTMPNGGGFRARLDVMTWLAIYR